ncbi:NAD(P)-binding domain-containing protein [Rhizobium mongolense]
MRRLWKEIDRNIGIIGAGNIGGTLTRRFPATGYNVSLPIRAAMP